MKNLYILITPPGQSKANFLEALTKGKSDGKPHQLVHSRWNLDQTKVVIQGEFSDANISWFQTKPWAEILGEYKDGFAEQAVLDYFRNNSQEWESDV